jgi:hypothetical protein
MLVRDEECPRKRRIIPERPVYRARGVRSDARQNVGRRRTLPHVNSRTLGRWRRDRENRRGREYQGER